MISVQFVVVIAIFQYVYGNWFNQLVTNEVIWPKVILVFG